MADDRTSEERAHDRGVAEATQTAKVGEHSEHLDVLNSWAGRLEGKFTELCEEVRGFRSDLATREAIEDAREEDRVKTEAALKLAAEKQVTKWQFVFGCGGLLFGVGGLLAAAGVLG